MKKYIYLFLVLFIVGACESELKITSPSSLTYQGFWDSESGARAAQTGLYGSFRAQTNTIFSLGELRSELWGGPTIESPFDLNFIQSIFTTTTAPYGGWANFYGRIHQVNDFLENIPEVDFQNEADQQHFMGQAYGLRAFYYYTLLKTWGEVPISTEAFKGESTEGLSRARSSEQEVMQLIKDDIENSLRAFGEDASFWNGSRTYWSKAATLTLKGDVYIWSGRNMGGGDADYQTAKTALEQVESIGSVGLVANYGDLWGSGNEDNPEFIFAVNYREDEASNFFNSFTGRSTEIHQHYDDKGNFLDGMIINGANRYGPSLTILQALDDNRDSRKDATFIRMYKDGNGYPSFTESKYYSSILNKFLGRVDGAQRIFDSDFPLYRYADVILLKAEAKTRLGEDPSNEINLIRERAYGSNFNASLAYSSGSEHANMEAILHERLLEFVAEGKRWWDLRRAGDQYVIDHVDFLNPGEEYKLLLPITEDMLGRNPLLQQTTGWQ